LRAAVAVRYSPGVAANPELTAEAPSVATALPALIGIRTIRLLRQAGAAALEEKVKIPRAEVRSIVRKLTLSFASKRTLQRLYR